MSGGGIQPAGTSSAGIGAPTEGNPQSGVIFEGLDRTSNGSRYIDQRTRDFVMNADGRASGMPNAAHLVQVAITTELNSSSMNGLGQELKKLDRITPNFKKRVLGVLTQALQHLINAKIIEVVDFADYKSSQTDRGLSPGRVYGRLLWRDLTSKGEMKETAF